MTMRQRLLSAVLAIALLGGAAPGQAQSAGDSESVTVHSVGGDTPIPATLLRPAGNGPFPAIVILHDCSGLGGRSSGAPGRWAKLLVAEGYVILIPDSFTPRGLPEGVCTAPLKDGRRATGFIRAGDAYGALAYLRTLPYVDGKHVGVMGGSHGGWSTLATMSDRGGDAALAAARQDGFAAAVALYPSCSSPFGTWRIRRANGEFGPPVAYEGIYQPLAPVYILVGDQDDWTPAEPCRHLVAAAQAAGYPIQLKVYPGARHSFDSFAPIRYVAQRNNMNQPDGKGATTGGDATAWEDAKQEVKRFFAAHLKGTP
jgi:dienelactone hydrolase